MNVREWQSLRRLVHEDFYDDLVETAGCGAFDGGCLVVAEALRKVIGGEIVVLVRDDGMADHAAVLFEGKLWDYYGPMFPGQFIARFNRAEAVHSPWICIGYRPIHVADLEGAYRDDDLADRLASKFRVMLGVPDHQRVCPASPSFG
jgi:hypothetical protein